MHQPTTFRPYQLVTLLFAALVAACSGRPSGQEVVDRSTPVICDKVKECKGELRFSTAFPGGIEECVTKTKEELTKKYGDDLEKSSVCTDEELDKCLEDLKAQTCAPGADPSIPCNC